MKLPTPGATDLSRRSALRLAAILAAAVPSALPALALEQPRAIDERIDGDTALPQLAREYAVRVFGPQPRQLPRRRLDLDFAVLLMRTSYSAADELDFMPIDLFQKRFFLLRQDEWSSYRDKVGRTMQGDLADPNYFDFISYCQYAMAHKPTLSPSFTRITPHPRAYDTRLGESPRHGLLATPSET